MPDGEVFHAGEQALQARIGVRERMAFYGPRAIRDFLPDQHRAFFPLLTYLPVAVLGQGGWPIGTMLTGAAGFVTSPAPRSLRVAALAADGDPAAAGLSVSAPIGILGIDLSTRRRNRANGRITKLDDEGFSVGVEQSFGNCAQYIQLRDVAVNRGVSQVTTETLASLDAPARTMVAGSDTFFVASSAGAAGLDMSHRGGRPGFVRVDDDRLTVPDFAGNRYFNTLGNFLVDPRAGLLFADFTTGDLLQLTGNVELVWDGEEVREFEGAQRLWRVHVTQGWRRRGALPFRWSFREYAPSTERTGIWATPHPDSHSR
jgi:uncharacterized protein